MVVKIIIKIRIKELIPIFLKKKPGGSRMVNILRRDVSWMNSITDYILKLYRLIVTLVHRCLFEKTGGNELFRVRVSFAFSKTNSSRLDEK